MSKNSVIQLTVDIQGRVSGLQDELKKVQDQLKTIKGPEKVTDSLNQGFKEIQERLKKVKDYTENNELSIADKKKVENELRAIENQYKSLYSKLENNKKKFSPIGTPKEIEKAREATDKYKKAILDANDAAKKNQETIKQNVKELEKAAAAQKRNVSSAKGQLTKAKNEQKEALKEQSIAQEAYDTRKQGYLNKGFSEKQANYYMSGTKELEALVAADAKVVKSAEKVSEAQKKLALAENASAVATMAYNEEANKQDEAFKKITEDLNKLTSEEFNKLKNTLTTLSQSFDFGFDISSIENVNQLEEALQKIDDENFEHIRPQLQAVIDLLKRGKEAARDMREEEEANAEALKKFNSQLDAIKNKIKNFISLGSAVHLFRKSVHSAYNTVKDLDQVMTQMAVVTKYNISDLWEKLPEYTQRANELGVTIHDAYESMTIFLQQGLAENEALELSTETLKMARIAGLNASDATDRMTNALRGFNMELNAVNAQRVDDVYNNLAAKTAANVDEISTAMTKVASLAHNANMEFETTAAFLAQIVETTRESAETAGTALKTVVARFSEVKKAYTTGDLLAADENGEEIDVNKVSEALRTAGINLNEYLTGAKGLDDVFIELASKWDSLDRVQQRYIATMAAGSRQQSRFIAMMSDYKRTTELVGYAYDSTGFAESQYEKTLESLESKLNQLKNAWNTFTMSIINNDVFKFVVDRATEFLSFLNDIFDDLPGLLESLVKTLTLIITGWNIKKLISPQLDSVITLISKKFAPKLEQTITKEAGEAIVEGAAGAAPAAGAAGTSLGAIFSAAFMKAAAIVAAITAIITVIQKINEYENGRALRNANKQAADAKKNLAEVKRENEGVANSLKKIENSSAYKKLKEGTEDTAKQVEKIKDKLEDINKINSKLQIGFDEDNIADSLENIHNIRVELDEEIRLAQIESDLAEIKTMRIQGLDLMPGIQNAAENQAEALAGEDKELKNAIKLLGIQELSSNEWHRDEIKVAWVTDYIKKSLGQDVVADIEAKLEKHFDRLSEEIKEDEYSGSNLSDEEIKNDWLKKNLTEEVLTYKYSLTSEALSEWEKNRDQLEKDSFNEVTSVLKDYYYKAGFDKILSPNTNYNTVANLRDENGNWRREGFDSDEQFDRFYELVQQYPILDYAFKKFQWSEKEEYQKIGQKYLGRDSDQFLSGQSYFGNLEKQDYEATIENFGRYLNSVASAIDGEEFEKNISAIEKELNAEAGEIEKFRFALNSLDFSNLDSLEGFMDDLENSGIELTEDVRKKVGDFIDSIEKATGATKKYSAVALNNGVPEITQFLTKVQQKGLKDSSITKKEYKALIQMFPELKSQFTPGEKDKYNYIGSDIQKTIKDFGQELSTSILGAQQQLTSQIQAGQIFDTTSRNIDYKAEDFDIDDKRELLQNYWNKLVTEDVDFNDLHIEGFNRNTDVEKLEEAYLNAIFEQVVSNAENRDAFTTQLDELSETNAAFLYTQSGYELARQGAKTGVGDKGKADAQQALVGLANKYGVAEEEITKFKKALESTNEVEKNAAIIRMGSIVSAYQEAEALGLDADAMERLARQYILAAGYGEEESAMAYDQAVAVAQLNAGLDPLVQNYTKWVGVLWKAVDATKEIDRTTPEYAEALKEVAEATQKILHTSDKIDNDFFEQEGVMKLLEDISVADTEEEMKAAIEELQDKYNEYYTIKINLQAETGEVTDEVAELVNLINTNPELNELDFGAVLNTGPFLGQLADLLTKSGLAEEEIQKTFDNMGYSVQFTYDDEIIGYERAYMGPNAAPQYMPITKKVVTGVEYVRKKDANINSSILDKAKENTRGSKGGKTKNEHWENPYDELYNLSEKINESLRTREALERRYNQLLKDRSSNMKDIREEYNHNIEALRQEADLQSQMAQGRLRQIANIGNEVYTDSEGNRATFSQLGVTKYASYDASTGHITIDWEGLEQLEKTNNVKKGEAAEAYISQLEEWVENYEEVRDALWDIEDKMEEFAQKVIDSYLSFEERVMDAVVHERQQQIDNYQTLSDAIKESNDKVIEAMRESIDMERQIRDNTKTEEDIADKEQRLAYLQRDTSGANQVEQMQLQKEIDDARQDYTDTLIDQAIETLSKQNEDAYEQRQEQIEMMQTQLNFAQAEGLLWNNVYELMAKGIDPNTGIVQTDSELVRLLKNKENWVGQSLGAQEVWLDNFNKDYKNALVGLTELEAKYGKDMNGDLKVEDSDTRHYLEEIRNMASAVTTQQAHGSAQGTSGGSGSVAGNGTNSAAAPTTQSKLSNAQLLKELKAKGFLTDATLNNVYAELQKRQDLTHRYEEDYFKNGQIGKSNTALTTINLNGLNIAVEEQDDANKSWEDEFFAGLRVALENDPQWMYLKGRL